MLMSERSCYNALYVIVCSKLSICCWFEHSLVLKNAILLSILVYFFSQVMIYRPLKRYLCDVVNFVEWIMYISSFVYFVPLFDKTHIQIGAGAIAVFLAWVNFTLFLRIFSPLGIYIIMAKKVLMSILKVRQ